MTILVSQGLLGSLWQEYASKLSHLENVLAEGEEKSKDSLMRELQGVASLKLERLKEETRQELIRRAKALHVVRPILWFRIRTDACIWCSFVIDEPPSH